MDKDTLGKIRDILSKDMEMLLEDGSYSYDSDTFIVYNVFQSYISLLTIDRLESIDKNLTALRNFIDE